MRNITIRAVGATVVLAGVAIAAISQTGSGGSGPIELAPDTSVSVVTTVGPSSSTSPGEPFTYRIGILANITTNNFWRYYGQEATSWNAYVLGATKPSLYGIDQASHSLDADLASDPEPPAPTKVGKAWRVDVAVQTGELWSDGSPISAHDVEFTFQTVRRLSLGGAWSDAYPKNIKDVIALSSTLLRVEFNHRPTLGEWPYALGLAPIMPQQAWATIAEAAADSRALYDSDGVGDLSGGPLVILETGPDRITASVNHRRVDSAVDEVVFQVFDSEEAAAEGLISGDIDIVLSPSGLSAETASRLAGRENIGLERSPANSVRYLGFNLDRAPMSDLAFRKAVALVFDRVGISHEIVPDASAAFSMLPDENPGWFDRQAADAIADGFAGPLAPRVQEAVSLLEGSGYTWKKRPTWIDGRLEPGTGLKIDGMTPAPLTILTPGDLYDPDRPQYAERIADTVEALGFEVHVVVTDFETVSDLAFNPDPDVGRQYDMYLLGWTLGNPTYPSFYGPFFASSGDANSTGFDNAEFDDEWKVFNTARDLDEARSALWGMEAILAEQLPYLTLYHPELVEAYRSDRIEFALLGVLGGIQGRSGGLEDVIPAGE